jgi:hypothetical protein
VIARKSNYRPRSLLLALTLAVLLLGGGCAAQTATAERAGATPTQTVMTVEQSRDLTEQATPTNSVETIGVLASETPAALAETITATPESPAATATRQLPSPTPDYTPTPDLRPLPNAWRSWPVIPAVSQNAIDIYQRGLAMGNDPHTFSIIGDCQSEPPVFFGIYSTDRYFLQEDEQYLQETIAHFQGNFDRLHATVKNGLSVASVFSPLWAPKEVCQPGETPLECEFRLYRPSIVFINLGTNWTNGDGYTHVEPLRDVVEFVIAQGALPILSTKGDNQEGDHSINLTTARLAYEYDIPLWNYWSAIQFLPNKGLAKERQDPNYLSVEAWDVRSYTGLRTLDRVWRIVNGMEIPES